MAATPQNVKALAPEFEALSDERVQLYLDIASQMIAPAPWSTAYDRAQTLLAAHLITMGGRQGASGPVTSVKVGQVSVNYGATQGEQDALAVTAWGQMFLELRRAWIVSPMVI